MSISILRGFVVALMFSLLPGAAMLWSGPAVAEGALAVGVPKNVAKDGFAYGYTNDKATADAASAEALATCKKPASNKSPRATAICAVIASYHDQCVAVSEDPQAGTPGVGWAVAGDLRSAESQALANCEKTAGPKRRAACIVDHSECDGTGKKN